VLPEGREKEEIEFSWAGETARHLGSVVHRWLQRIAEDELRGWDARRIDALVGRFHRELQRRGVRTPERQAASDMVRTALANTLSDERGRWVLGAHAEAHNEHRIRVLTSEGMRTYVIDRFFNTSDGQRWVVDYKTSRHEGAGLEQFLDQEQRRYAHQLSDYQRAIKGSRVGLYFPLLRGWRQSGF
jgi:ATP-dependent helicase/nuclease subunit A